MSLKQIDTGRTLRAAEWLERMLYREAAAVVAVTQPFCDHVDAIRDCPAADDADPERDARDVPRGAAENGRAALGASDSDFVVTFAGTHGIAQGLDTIVRRRPALDGEAASPSSATAREGALVQLAAERGRANVAFHPQVPLAEIPPLLAASDALLVPLSAHPTFRDFVPSKLIDAMAVGRPVILSAAESRRDSSRRRGRRRRRAGGP